MKRRSRKPYDSDDEACFIRGEVNLMAAVLRMAIHDAFQKHGRVTPALASDARNFLLDKYPSAWGLFASEMAEYAGCGGGLWIRGIRAGLDRKNENIKLIIEYFENKVRRKNEEKFDRKG